VALIAVIPISNYIGDAVGSIAAQTTPVLGALLNGGLECLVEIIVYLMAIREGMGDLAREAIVGTVLAMLLLLPGLAMVFGGMKYKRQEFNRFSAGVSSVLLLVAIIGTIAPTVLFDMYSNIPIQCAACSYNPKAGSLSISCDSCHYAKSDTAKDSIYIENVRPMQLALCGILPIAYIAGVHPSLIKLTPAHLILHHLYQAYSTCLRLMQ